MHHLNLAPADIDGNLEYEAIDIVILEESKESNRPPDRNVGRLLTVIIGSSVVELAFTISKRIT